MKFNFFSYIPKFSEKEIIETILKNKSIIIERIVSYGFPSPDDFWYNQNTDEWVILLDGFAEIEFIDGNIVELSKGDYLLIPAHKKHRVKYCSKEPNCVWLAIHFKSNNE